MTHGVDGNGSVCVWSNLKCLERKCTYLRSGQIKVFIQVGEHSLWCPHLAITPSPLTITVIQAMMQSIDYINPLSTANLNASCLHSFLHTQGNGALLTDERQHSS